MTTFPSGCSRFALLSVALCLSSQAQSVIVTAAGTDLVFTGNGKIATGVSLGRVASVTVDPNGRPVFSDPDHHLVLRVESDGSIAVIAGNNVQGLGTAHLTVGPSGGGYSGDKGLATAAALNRPEGVAYDKLGNLYIADTFNDRIRIVNAQGVIDTFAGDGAVRFQNGSALNASFNTPEAMVIDNSGNVYVYDRFNYVIRKISQGAVSTFCGTAGTEGTATDNVTCASAPINFVSAMATDSQGNLYFAEPYLKRVRKVVNGTVTTLLGPAQVGYPSGLAFDTGGNLLISDADDGKQIILRLAGGSTGGALTTIAGNGQKGFSGDGRAGPNAAFYDPFGLAVSPSGIYIADRENFRIRRLDAQNNVSTVAGDGQLLPAQDGRSATLATFLDPFGVSFNSQGTMLIADTNNNIVRRMNPNGTLNTIAGNGAENAVATDTGPATKVGMYGPFSVTADAVGNLYESEFDASLVRKIGLDGQISTLACGSKQFPFVHPAQTVLDPKGILYIADWGSSQIIRCDSGTLTTLPGTFASPGGLAIDPAGANLYVTEWAGAQVVRIALSNFAVTRIAGGGNIVGSAADGLAATSARLGRPAGIVLDSQLNVYFTDSQDGTVRRIAARDGTISTIAGNFLSGFSGDGGPATSASLRNPWGLAFDPSGALYIADVANNRIRKLLINNPPVFTVDNAAVSISAPSSGNPPDAATVTLTASLPGLLYTASTDQPWLEVKPARGTMPASIQIAADPTGLDAGNYSGTVTVMTPGANPPARTIKVNFTVNAQLPPSLTTDLTNLPACLVDPHQCPTLGLSFVAGADPVSRRITVQNQGSGTLNFSAAVSLDSGTGWLDVSPAKGSASPTAPGSVTVNISPANLPPGTYSGTIRISSAATNQTVSIPVAIAVAAPATKPVLSQNGLTFQAMPGGGKPLPRTFSILNAGQGSMSWTAKATTLSGGSWLSVSPASGSVATPFTDTAEVKVSVDPSQTGGPGLYFGQVEVNTPGNAAQTVTVQLNVGTTAPLDIYPNGLLFQNQPGANNPGSQTISIANVSSQPVTFSTSRLVDTPQPWFVAVPSNGVIVPNQNLTIVVQPDFTNLPSGVSKGTLRMAVDGATFNVGVLAVVASGPDNSASGKDGVRLATGCTPKSLVVQPISITDPFSVALQRSIPLRVRVVDNCTTPMTSVSGNVAVHFSNGDAPLTMAHEGNGVWSKDWTPTISRPQVQMEIRALEVSGKDLVGGLVLLSGTMQPGGGTPSPRAVLNSASGASSYVSPGGYVSVYGEQLADQPADGPAPPPATQLNGTQVLLGGVPLLLNYASGAQVNAQIPFGLSVNTQLQLKVQRGVALSVPADIVVAEAQPGIYTQDGSGSGPGKISHGSGGNVPVTADAPATAGETVVIYCNGLGAVDPPVTVGTPTPLTGPPSRTINPVTVTIGGQSVEPDFAGLSPGSTDLYQVNVKVPAGVTGDAVSVYLTVAGQTSQTVTMTIGQ